jgi:hydrogenase maturation factor
VEEAKGLLGDEVGDENGLAQGSELGSVVVVHVGFEIVDCDRRFAKSASSSIVLATGDNESD